MKSLERSPLFFPGPHQSIGGELGTVIGDLSHYDLEQFLRELTNDASGYAMLAGSQCRAELYTIAKHFLARCGAGSEGPIGLDFDREMEGHYAVFILINSKLKLLQ